MRLRRAVNVVAMMTVGMAFQLIDGKGSAFAQGTPDQRAACTSDAFRLCGQFIPDADRIATCLHDAGPRLSSACYAVFYPQRAETPARYRRRYVAPRRTYNPDNDDE